MARLKVMTEDSDRSLNEKSFMYLSNNGTSFTAARCDFVGGVTVHTHKNLPIEKLLQDVGEMTAHHALMIRPELFKGFGGYDGIKYTVKSE